MLVSAVALAATTAFTGATSATAAGYFEAPYPAGESYKVDQGNGGAYSHTDAYNRYAWDLALPANYEVSATQGGTIVISNWSPYWQNGIEVIIRHPNGQCTEYATSTGRSTSRATGSRRDASSAGSAPPVPRRRAPALLRHRLQHAGLAPLDHRGLCPRHGHLGAQLQHPGLTQDDGVRGLGRRTPSAWQDHPS